MNKQLAMFWLCLASLAGTLASLAIPGYLIALLFALTLGVLAFCMMQQRSSKKLFGILVAVDFTAGFILRYVPHSYTGGLSGMGLLLGMLVWVCNLFYLKKIWGREKAST